ncbi:MAG TPA: 3-deoxy-7-phosphoheptulonate synthase [Victivallales bacterium]|nr:3-deoxy-7-phosphoheptulonate synthase [Victivallales bacterium]HRU01647.1 3-deoxy-7-phosphoheptulonate synthase [Victivallales bacterium]
MIIVFKPHTPEEKINEISEIITKLGYEPRVIRGVENTVIGAVGDEQMHKSLELLKSFSFIEDVIPIQKRYKLASREYNPNDSFAMIGNNKLGAGNFQIIAGPCGVESLEQLRKAAQDISACGVKILRGGAYKPRTSPYDFQGLGEEGVEILKQVKKETGMAVVTEVVGVTHIDKVASVAECFQIGARNCQNYHLLEKVAEVKKTVLLKRGPATTVEEWLSSAEYLLVNGCPSVILCERGIRTFETATRNTLDLGAVVVAKRESHLPVVVDPSHAAGKADLVLPLARAAIACGADGIIVETHPNPVEALSDASQQIPSGKFKDFIEGLNPLIELMLKIPKPHFDFEKK